MKILSTVLIVMMLSFLLMFCGCSKTKVEEPQVDINTTVETVEVTEPESETETVIITTSEETQKETEETKTEAVMNESNKEIAQGYLSEITETNFDNGLMHYFTSEEIAVLENALAAGYNIGEKTNIEEKYIIRMFDESESLIYEFVVDESGNVYSIDFCPVLNEEVNALIKEII